MSLLFTTLAVTSWSENVKELGPIYPFVGYELWMFLACVVFCVGFLVWKFYSEHRKYHR